MLLLIINENVKLRVNLRAKNEKKSGCKNARTSKGGV